LKQREPDQARRTAVLHNVLDDMRVWKLLKTDPGEAWENLSARYLHG
jgi:hypothetical protein